MDAVSGSHQRRRQKLDMGPHTSGGRKKIIRHHADREFAGHQQISTSRNCMATPQDN
jgi:hypothetical protein